MVDFPLLVTSNETCIEIIYSNSTANLVKYGTSIVTSSRHKDLELNPGQYSFDPDQRIFKKEVGKN